MTAPLYLCVHVCDFAAQVLARAHPLGSRAIAVLDGTPPLERVFAMNEPARRQGLQPGMSRVQAESFSAESFPIALLRRDRAQEDAAFAALLGCAERFSPRIEAIASPREESCRATLLLDVSGAERLLGCANEMAASMHRSIGKLGYEASVAAAHHAQTALLAARGTSLGTSDGRSGVTTIAPGGEAEALAPLPLSVLELEEAQAQTLAAWGIRTLGELAALPTRPLAARLGQSALPLQAQARGEYRHLLLPCQEPADAPLCESLELEHPVELLEPLLFLLNRMLEQIAARAAQRALAIASLELCLILDESAFEKNAFKENPSEVRRTVRPALPERDPATLLKLLQLELEQHPPEAAVMALRIEAHPARPQSSQLGLFAAQTPEAGRMEILLARLRKLVGEGRVGSPELLDSHAPESFRLSRFETVRPQPPVRLQPAAQRYPPTRLRPAAQRYPTQHPQPATHEAMPPPHHAPALRMLRPPRAVAIELRAGAPAAMRYEGERSIVQTSSGPWRSSGAWWTHPAWCREEWEIVVQSPAQKNAQKNVAPGGPYKPSVGVSGAVPQRCLRLAHDPASGGWYVIGIYD